MKKLISSLMAMVAMVVFATVAAAKPPSWDRVKSGKRRFKVLSGFNGEAVLDKETGLVWEQSPASTSHTWTNARFECTGRTTGGRKGWRLPSVHELASLVDPNNPGGNPDLPPGNPFSNVASTKYWSATTDADDSTAAWSVFFYDGDVNSDGKTSGALLVWCVRGGMNADQY